MCNQSLDYVVADAFAAAVNVKVWMDYEESCQFNLPRMCVVTFSCWSLRSLPAMHKVAKYIRLHRKSVVDGSFGDRTKHDAPKKV